jgi:hypothetical protein
MRRSAGYQDQEHASSHRVWEEQKKKGRVRAACGKPETPARSCGWRAMQKDSFLTFVVAEEMLAFSDGVAPEQQRLA